MVVGCIYVIVQHVTVHARCSMVDVLRTPSVATRPPALVLLLFVPVNRDSLAAELFARLNMVKSENLLYCCFPVAT